MWNSEALISCRFPLCCFVYPKSPTYMYVNRNTVGKSESVAPFQFGEIYEWTKPKSLRAYTQREFGRGDLRAAVWVIIQSSHSHISHLESHRLWERRDLSYTRRYCTCAASKSNDKQLATRYARCFHFATTENRLHVDKFLSALIYNKQQL